MSSRASCEMNLLSRCTTPEDIISCSNSLLLCARRDKPNSCANTGADVEVFFVGVGAFLHFPWKGEIRRRRQNVQRGVRRQ